MKNYRLTEYSHGAGCGCKISPKVLDTILQNQTSNIHFPNLLVGNDQRDDAAVFDLGDDTAIVSTTDFFMPIVDDPEDFGRIAAVNAISDIYAMGATPLMAIAILGWPINEIPPEVANQVIKGGRLACQDAGIPLAGGHSIDSPEPIFGLAVTGRVNKGDLKMNSGAETDCLLYLTKPLGVGILSTAQKKQKLKEAHRTIARDSMIQLNKAGAVFAKLKGVKAMTDVTGFGLLGHLCELCEASHTTADIYFDKVPFFNRDMLNYYLDEGCVPGGTHRNWESYGHKVGNITERQKLLLADPQTSGGLLVAVEKNEQQVFEATARKEGMEISSIGTLINQQGSLVNIHNSQ